MAADQFSVINPDTFEKSESVVTTVQFSKVIAMAAIIMSTT